MIIIEQAARVVFRAEYERDDLVNIIVEKIGTPRDELESLTDRELARMVLARANDYGSENNGYDVRDLLADDAGDYDPDQFDADDWTARIR